VERDMGKPDAEGRPLSHACAAGPSHARPPERSDPAGAGSRYRMRVGWQAVYCRSQTCDLQMKVTQPAASSFLPPSISASLDLSTLPSSGLRMVPPAYSPPPSAFMPRMISIPVIGLSLRSSLHLSQVGLGLLGLISSTMRPFRVPLAA